jgi:hypothetical protein
LDGVRFDRLASRLQEREEKEKKSRTRKLRPRKTPLARAREGKPAVRKAR